MPTRVPRRFAVLSQISTMLGDFGGTLIDAGALAVLSFNAMLHRRELPGCRRDGTVGRWISL